MTWTGPIKTVADLEGVDSPGAMPYSDSPPGDSLWSEANGTIQTVDGGLGLAVTSNSFGTNCLTLVDGVTDPSVSNAIAVMGEATADNAIALGSNATAAGASSTAIAGGETTVDAVGGVALGGDGTNVPTSSAQYAVAIGAGPTASGDFSTAIGQTATASGPNAVALGLGANAAASNAVALGTGDAEGANSFAVQGSATGPAAIALGSGANAGGAAAVAGPACTAAGDNAVAFGSGASASQSGSAAYGSGATCSGINSTAIGTVTCTANNAVAIAGNGQLLGFYGVAPVARQTVSGVVTDPVLTSLLAHLASLGLIINSTT